MRRIFVPTSNEGKLREFEHAFSLQGLDCLGINAALQECGGRFSWKTPVEDRETFTGNNCQKLFEGLRIFPLLMTCEVNSVVVDDSGLCVPRLGFLPGVHSATFGGFPRDDAKNRFTLIEKLKTEIGLVESEFEPAFFICSLLMASKVEELTDPTAKILHEDGFSEHLDHIESQVMIRAKSRLENSKSMAFGYKVNLEFFDQLYQISLVLGFCLGRVATFEQQLIEGEGHGYDAMFFPNASPHLSFASIPLHEKNQMSHRSEALRGLNAMVQSRIAQDEILELF